MPAVKSIFIANLAETALPLVHLMQKARGEREVFEDHALCDRFLFSEEDNRILITPFPIEKDFFRDATELLGLSNVINLWPKKVGESLCRSILQDQDLAEKLMEIIKANPEVELISYAATPEFCELVDGLSKKGLKFSTPEAPEKSDRWVSDFFDSKAGFRQAVSSLLPGFPSMPEGAICASREEVIGWAKRLLEKYDGCVLKTNRGLAGAGLKIIRKVDLKNESVDDFLTKLLAAEAFWQDFPIVVEAFIPPDLAVCGGAPNVELRIKDGKVEPLYVCSMRLTSEGVFLGVELGKEAMSKKLAEMLVKNGMAFGKLLKTYGYRGNFETDWVMGLDERPRPIEANLRRTGGTHVFELAQRLLGPDGSQNSYQVAINIYPVKKCKTYREIKRAAKDWLFPINKKKEGVILTIVNSLAKGNIGYVVIANNKNRTLEIEKDFLKIVG